MKKLLAILLLCSTLFVMVSCKPNQVDIPGEAGSGESTPQSTEASTTEDPNAIPQEDPNRELVIYENGKWVYNLVYPNSKESFAVENIIEFRYKLSAIVNIGIGISTDYLAPNEVHNDNEYEILVGNTTHEQSLKCYNGTSIGGAGVYVVGNKIVTVSYTGDGLDKCKKHLIDVFKANYKDGRIVVKVGDLVKDFGTDGDFVSIPSPDNLSYSFAEDCQYGQTLFLFENATVEAFNNYKAKYTDFVLVQEKTEAGNHFATYECDKGIVNLSFSKADNCIRVIINNGTYASPLLRETAATTTKKCEPLVIMHGLGWGTSESDILSHQNGLCLLFRLSDGRFLVVDGGFNRQKDADDLYKLLVKYSPSGMKPTVAGWFITHAHGDHHSTFASKFVNSYKSKVNIENVFFNPPSNKSSLSALKSAEALVINVTNSIDGCNFIRPHVGDRYYIGDAVVDFYYTVELYYPSTFSYYNTCSIMFSVTLGGQKTMVTGDCANISFDKAMKMFGDSLNSDIVQTAHHGYGTGVSDGSSTSVMQGYKYMSPTIVLWPLGNEHYASLSQKIYNKYLIALPSVKEIILAGKEDHVLQLPYQPK